MYKKQESGFSLVEVLVTTAIMAIIGLAVASFMADMAKQSRNLDSKNQLVDVLAEVRTELSSEAACLSSFGGRNPITGFNVTQLKDRNGSDSATKAPLKYGGVNRNLFSLTSMRVQDFNDAVTGVGDRIGSANFIMTFDIGQNGATIYINRSIRLHAEVDPSGNIVRCLALSGMTDGIWQKVSTSSQNIFYSSGNVGIGTDNPATALHLASGTMTQQSGDVIANPTANVTTIGRGARLLRVESAHPTGLEVLSGAGPSGNQVGFANGSAMLSGSNILLMNSDNSASSQLFQDGAGLNIFSAGSFTLRSQNNILQVGTATTPTAVRILTNAPGGLVIERQGSGTLNSSIQYLNGSAKTIYAGMASDETFGVGPNANLTSGDTWFEVNRSRGAQIRSADPTVLMLTREATGMNTAMRFYNGNYNLYAGMSSTGEFAVDTDENLQSSPFFRVTRAGNAHANDFIKPSDERLKKNIHPIPNSLEKILQLEGVEYEWKKTTAPQTKEVGFIAQSIRKIFPDAVIEDAKTGLLSVRYLYFIAPIVESIKSLFNGQEEQAKEIAEMKQSLAEMKAEIQKLKSEKKTCE